MSTIDIFISHSAQDVEIAEALVVLLRSALDISAERIRCTSVDGYRLPAGAPTETRLKQEVYDAKVFIGLITSKSLQSAYVLFELGARWGAGLQLIPLLAAGTNASNLRGPLSGLNALNCEISAQIFQLIYDICSVLEIRQGNPASYNKNVEQLIQISIKHKRETGILAICNNTMTGNMIGTRSSGIEVTYSMFLLPITVLNKTSQPINLASWYLWYKVEGEWQPFENFPIPADARFNSSTQNIDVPTPDKTDLLKYNSAFTPNEAISGNLMFIAPEDEVPLEKIQKKEGENLRLACTDIYGEVYEVNLISSNEFNPTTRLGISVIPSSEVEYP